MPTPYGRWVAIPYTVGSLAFLCGAWLQLQMWKSQQFGLGFIREINPLFKAQADAAAHESDKDGYAGGWWSQISLAI